MDIENQIIIYQDEDGETRIEVRFTGETVWLSQQQLCDLYHTSKANVSEHIKYIFEDGELDEDSVVRNFRTTVTDGKNLKIIPITFSRILLSFASSYHSSRTALQIHWMRTKMNSKDSKMNAAGLFPRRSLNLCIKWII